MNVELWLKWKDETKMVSRHKINKKRISLGGKSDTVRLLKMLAFCLFEVLTFFLYGRYLFKFQVVGKLKLDGLWCGLIDRDISSLSFLD